MAHGKSLDTMTLDELLEARFEQQRVVDAARERLRELRAAYDAAAAAAQADVLLQGLSPAQLEAIRERIDANPQVSRVDISVTAQG